MTSVLLIAALLFGSPVAQKKRDWKEAKILDVLYEKKFEDTGASGTGAGNGSMRITRDTWKYIVEIDGMRYELEEQNTRSTYGTGEMLKFAIEKKNWYFMDKKGKEKKGDVVGRKELKTP